jgi:predicted lipid-binding transport protein (Tim44 family)
MPDQNDEPTPGPTALLAARDEDPAEHPVAHGHQRRTDHHDADEAMTYQAGNGAIPGGDAPMDTDTPHGTGWNGRVPAPRDVMATDGCSGHSGRNGVDARPVDLGRPWESRPEYALPPMFDNVTPEAGPSQPTSPPYTSFEPVPDAPGAHPPSSRGTTVGGLLAALMAGVLLGGVVGGFAGAATGGVTASALVEIAAPDDPGIAVAYSSGSAQSSDSLANFAANEFASLSSDAFRDQVAERAGTPDGPSITVTRVGQSTVADFSATGATDELSLKVVQTGVDLYVERRTNEHWEHIRSSIASIDTTLAEIQAPPADPRQSVDPNRAALVDRLLSARSDLLLLQNRDTVPIQVVEPPAVAATGGLATWLLGAVLGALVGGLLAIGLMTLVRSRSTIIRDTPAAESVLGQILHPVISLSGDWPATGLQVLRTRDRYAAKVLAGQVSGPTPLTGRTIGVVAASGDSASRAVATLLAVGASDLVPTVLVEFGAECHPLVPGDGHQVGVHLKQTEIDGLTFTRVKHPAGPGRAGDAEWRGLIGTIRSGQRCVVIDVGTRPELLRLLPMGVEPVVVVGLGIDDEQHVAALAAGLPEPAGPTVGVATHLPWSHRQQLKLRRRRNG